jgi:hypothetical protein
LPLAHLPSSMATPLDPLRWLAPPQRAPEPQPPLCTSDAATSALAHYDKIISQWMISLYKQALAECAELPAHAQRVETARSVALAAWRRQEDAVHAQALAEEAVIQCQGDNTFRAITNGFAIGLDILAVEMASWHGADDVMALLGMKRREDNANAQGYLDGRAARALQNASARVNVLAASRCQEDDMHAKAFASKADKRTRQETTLHATQLQYMAQLGFTSSSEFFAWIAECDASWDGTVAEAPNRTLALAEKALAKERHCHETAAQEKVLADKANKRRQAAALEKALADDANKQRQAAAQERALADNANEQRWAAARDKALADEANKQRRHEPAERAMTSPTKALAEDEHNEDDNNVARQIEAYAAPFFARVDIVMAKIRAMDDGFGNWAAFGDEILAEEDDKASALTMPPSATPTAVSPTPHRPTTYKDAVLATMGGSLCAKSLVVAPLSCPSTMVDDQLQMACCRSRPRCRVGCRHGPWAPNPQSTGAPSLRVASSPRTPNKYTSNG